MNRICFAAVTGIVAGLVQAESIKGLSSSQIAERDKQNWGDKSYSASTAAGGQETVAGDLAMLKTNLGRELLMMNSLMQKTRKDMASSGGPDYWFQDALNNLTKPLSRLPARDFGNLQQLTPAEQRGVKGYQSALHAIDHISATVRARIREDVACAIQVGVFHKYIRFSNAKKYFNDNDQMLIALQHIDYHYGDMLKDFDAMVEGRGKYRPTADELALPADRQRYLDRMMKDRDFTFLNARGRMSTRLYNNVHILDKYLARTSDRELEEFSKAVDAHIAAHNKAGAAIKEMEEWYLKNALSIDPYPREFIAKLIMSYNNFIHEEMLFLAECDDLVKLFRENSGNIGKLRQCRDISPNKAFFLKFGNASNGTPDYMSRISAIGAELVKRFDDAAIKIHRRANGKAKPFVL